MTGGDYILEDFRRGVDVRRAPFAAPAGALSKGVNVHVTSGGDIEKRKAFVKVATLPVGCFGLCAIHETLLTFGSAAAPTMPSGFTYQRLQHPAGAAMTALVKAEPNDGKAFAIARYGDDTRTFYDAARVLDLDTDACRFRFSVTAGSAGAGNKVSSVTVNAVEILGADVLWTTSDEATALLIAAQINAHGVYRAYVPTGMAEVVVASPLGTISTGQAVVVTPAGTLTVAPASGAMEAPPAPPTSALTVGEKVYVTSGPNLLFCAVGDPPNFSPNSIGGGFINMSTQSSGAEQLLGLELFYDDIMVYAGASAQRWHVEADDSQNKRVQTFRNVGILGARATMAYLDGPTFFVSRQGVRAVQNQYYTGRGLVRSDSKAIDKLLRAEIKALSADARSKVIMFTEPEEDRMWVILGSTIHVRTWFLGDNEPSWTSYEPGFVIDDYAILDGTLYLLSGRDVYLYGGTTGEEFEAVDAVVRFPYANLRAPASLKDLHGVDFGIEGEWAVAMSQDPDDIDFVDSEDLGTYTRQTFDQPDIPIASQTAHVSLELRHSKAQAGRISSIVFHYKTAHQG